MKLLVEFSKDWADEFYCDGYKIYSSQEDWDAAVLNLADLEYNFGTNEGWEQGEIEISDFTASQISDEEAGVIEKLLGNQYGIFPL